MTDNRRYRNKKGNNKPDSYLPPFAEDILNKNIDILKLNETTKTLLDGAKVLTIRDVVKREDKDFYKISTFNKKNLFDLKNALKAEKLFLKPTPEIVVIPTNQETATEAPNNNPSNNLANNQVNKPPFNSNKAPNSNNFNNNNRQNNNNNNNNSNNSNRQNNKQSTQQNNRFNNNNNSNNINNNYNNNNNRQQKENCIPYMETTKVVHPPKPGSETVKEIPDIYVKVNKNGKWGFKDREGNQVVAPLYDELFNFKEDICCVQLEESFGFVNRKGEEVVPLVYNCASSFSEGLACVFKGEKCGYINTANEVVIDFKFDAGTPVMNGECRVKKDGKWGELHINPPKEDTPDSVIPIALGIENIRWII